MTWILAPVIVVLLVLVLVLMSLRIITEYERAVHFRLGHLRGAKGPGVIIVLPIIDRIERISLRTVALQVPTQELVTKDNVTVKVNGVTYYAVRDRTKAVMSVQNFAFATAQVAQATLLFDGLAQRLQTAPLHSSADTTPTPPPVTAPTG